MQLTTILKILATIILLGFLASRMDLANLSEVLVSASLLGMLIPIVIQVSNVLISVTRWQAILGNFGIYSAYLPLARLTFIGYFFSLFLPSSIGGDFVKAYYLAKRHGRGMPTSLTTTFMERSGGLCALLIIGIGASLNRNLIIHEVPLIWIFLILASGYVAVNFALFNRHLHSVLARFLQRFRLEDIEAKMDLVSHGLTTLIRNSQAIAVVLLISLLIQFMSILMIWTCSLALGIQAPFSAFLIFVPLINLSIMVPLTINGFGLRESLYFLLFTQIGVDDEQAVALSLVNALVVMIAALPGGLFYSLQKKTEKIDGIDPETISKPTTEL